MGRQNLLGPDKLYRLSLVDNDTHDVVKVMLVSRIRATIIAIASGIGIILLIYSIIAFTPLRSTIPGYPDAHSKKVALANAIKIDSLENIITRWDLYAENLSRVLSGEKTVNFDSIIRNTNVNYLSAKSKAELSRQDSLLAESVRKAERFGVSRSSERNVPVEGKHFFTPLKGAISSTFNAISSPGITISSAKGSIVSSVLDGTVTYTAWNDNDKYVIIIQHSDNIMSIYSNIQNCRCHVGDVISAGTPIAVIEDNLHFELWHNGSPLDPVKYISF